MGAAADRFIKEDLSEEGATNTPSSEFCKEKACNLLGHVVKYRLQGQLRGYSAVGSASEWHSEGQGFESPYLH